VRVFNLKEGIDFVKGIDFSVELIFLDTLKNQYSVFSVIQMKHSKTKMLNFLNKKNLGNSLTLFYISQK